MPCSDNIHWDRQESQAALDIRTAMLCRLCKTLETQGLLHLLDAGTAEWWTEHKKFDDERKPE